MEKLKSFVVPFYEISTWKCVLKGCSGKGKRKGMSSAESSLTDDKEISTASNEIRF